MFCVNGNIQCITFGIWFLSLSLVIWGFLLWHACLSAVCFFLLLNSSPEPWFLISEAVLCLVAQSCLSLCDPMDCSPPGSSVHGISQARIQEWVAIPSSRGLPNPGIKPKSPSLQVDSLPPEPPGKPRNAEEGHLSLLQQIFPTQ